jgi:hypothetical protein
MTAPRTSRPSLRLRLFVVGYPLLLVAVYIVLSDPWWAGALTALAAAALTGVVLWPRRAAGTPRS